MSYYEKVIQPGETILYNKKIHWIVYLPAILLFIAGVLIGVAVGAHINDGARYFFSLGGFFIGASLFFMVRAWIMRMATEIVVTDKRIILKMGFIQRNTMEMNMDKVETVDVAQSILGRIMDYGTVIIRGVGSSYEPLKNVTSPLELRNVIVVR